MKEILTESLESIFDNTERIHGKSEAVDWQRTALHKGATYMTEIIREFVSFFHEKYGLTKYYQVGDGPRTYPALYDSKFQSIDEIFDYWYNNFYKK